PSLPVRTEWEAAGSNTFAFQETWRRRALVENKRSLTSVHLGIAGRDYSSAFGTAFNARRVVTAPVPELHPLSLDQHLRHARVEITMVVGSAH
ncbi:hypothetical protein QJQ45_027651, partial [Haematococcus lacustris]